MKHILHVFSGCLLLVLTYLPAAQASETPAAEPQHLETAIFAGGCFWCTESDFEFLDGVVKVISGYTGGTLENPTYQQVSSGTTRHLESVEVTYDPQQISYRQLLDAFWKMIDPTDAGGQFVDRGHQYTSAIFVRDAAQRAAAEASRDALAKSGRYDKPIVTEIRDAGPFYPAEEYHQDYYKHNPIRYHFYRWNSGRDQYLKKVWGDQALHP